MRTQWKYSLLLTIWPMRLYWEKLLKDNFVSRNGMGAKWGVTGALQIVLIFNLEKRPVVASGIRLDRAKECTALAEPSSSGRPTNHSGKPFTRENLRGPHRSSLVDLLHKGCRHLLEKPRKLPKNYPKRILLPMRSWRAAGPCVYASSTGGSAQELRIAKKMRNDYVMKRSSDPWILPVVLIKKKFSFV